MLRAVGNRFGPVLRSHAVDSAARQMEWSESMDELAARRRPGRFARDQHGAGAPQQDFLNR